MGIIVKGLTSEEISKLIHADKCLNCKKKIKLYKEFLCLKCYRYLQKKRREEYNANYIKLKKENKFKRTIRKNNPNKKSQAQQITNDMINKGLIKRLPCILCGKKRTVAHHEDYNYPKKVTWLCYPHHNRLHHGKKEVREKIKGEIKIKCSNVLNVK